MRTFNIQHVETCSPQHTQLFSFVVLFQVKVSLLNFTITIKGLEEQLLNTAVKEELPDLAQKKVPLHVFRGKQQSSVLAKHCMHTERRLHTSYATQCSPYPLATSPP